VHDVLANHRLESRIFDAISGQFSGKLFNRKQRDCMGGGSISPIVENYCCSQNIKDVPPLQQSASVWILRSVCVILFSVQDRTPTLVWNPKVGYSCSACNWTKQVHVGPRLPNDDDELLRMVREEFAEHVREKHAKPKHDDFSHATGRT